MTCPSLRSATARRDAESAAASSRDVWPTTGSGVPSTPSQSGSRRALKGTYQRCSEMQGFIFLSAYEADDGSRPPEPLTARPPRAAGALAQVTHARPGALAPVAFAGSPRLDSLDTFWARP